MASRYLLRGTPPCGNTSIIMDGESVACTKPGTNICGGCFLINYCSKECQITHRNIHKHDCKSPLMKETWKPAWHTQGRQPIFITNDENLVQGLSMFGVRKFLWGNMPALDILGDGAELPEDLRLLFAASGDIRNVIASLTNLPDGFTGTCTTMINDRDFDIVARNAILLLTALHFPAEEAVPIMLHLWYSALVPSAILLALQTKILPLIEYIVEKIRDRPAYRCQAKTWRYGARSLRLVLFKEQWTLLLSYFKVPNGLSGERAMEVRRATTMAPHRKDFTERKLYCQPLSQRVCTMKFRGDGILLPFGASRDEFQVPNPTFYQTVDAWPMQDSADPLEGWSIAKVKEIELTAKNDVYGRLFFYIQKQLLNFCNRIAELKVNFQLYQLDARELPETFKACGVDLTHYFDKIELSNITDTCYLGPECCLSTFGPLLKRQSQNPSATILGLFLNAVHEQSTSERIRSTLQAEVQQCLQYMPQVAEGGRYADQYHADQYHADLIKLNQCWPRFRDFDALFETYMSSNRFVEISAAAGLQIKDVNTIVPMWPLRLRQGATQEEFDELCASSCMGSERYVEWGSVD